MTSDRFLIVQLRCADIAERQFLFLADGAIFRQRNFMAAVWRFTYSLAKHAI